MRILKPFLAALAVTAIAGPALAEAKLYPYHSKENYCPQGLQPITMAGVICCGTPNQKMSYRQVMAHPVAKTKKHYSNKARGAHNCPEGVKGCY